MRLFFIIIVLLSLFAARAESKERIRLDLSETKENKEKVVKKTVTIKKITKKRIILKRGSLRPVAQLPR